MDENQREYHGHPVIAGLVTAAAAVGTIAAARAYLAESTTPQNADRILGRMFFSVGVACAAVLGLIVIAGIVAYSSLRAADIIFAGAFILLLAVCVPVTCTLLGYASKHSRRLGQSRHCLRK